MGWAALGVAAAMVTAGCDDGPTAPPVVTADAGDDVAPVTDAPSADLGRDAPAVDVPPEPYDAGPAPACDRSPTWSRVGDRDPLVQTLEPGGIVPYRGGFVIAVRQSVPRTPVIDGGVSADAGDLDASADAGLRRRDTVDLLTLDANGAVQRPLATVYASAASGTDLSTPTLARLGDGAVVLFRESRGLPGGEGFTTRIQSVLVDNAGAPGNAAPLIEDQSDPFLTNLPDGTPFGVATRLVRRLDGGVIVAAPNSFRVAPGGTLVSPGLIDLTRYLPLSATSVLLRARPEGAALVFKVGADLQTVRFDAQGVVDPRSPRVTANVNPPRIDDAALVNDAVIAAWAEPFDLTNSVVRVLVAGPSGAVVARVDLERVEGDPPWVGVAPIWGGAAVMWVRGAGEGAVLRGVRVQPDGVVAGSAVDLVPVPGANGRLALVSEGRQIIFTARADQGGTAGVGFGRVCFPAM
ncbi:MAG: hypothetical protein R3A52_21050 [Polyangiales bacterium]